MELKIPPLSDYELFAKMDYWTTGEAACLTLGLDPRHAHDILDEFLSNHIVGDPSPAILNRLSEIINLMERFIDTGDLLTIRHKNPLDVWTADMPHYLLSWNEYQILPFNFINWAESKGLDLPKELIEAVRRYQVSPANKELKDPSCLTEEKTTSADEFVRSLRVDAENDSEITIQEPGKTPITYHCSYMGFKNENVKTWKLLIGTLRRRPHLIELPKRTLRDGRRNKEYDNERRLLSNLNKKLVAIFNRIYPLDFPKDYKLYERDKPKGHGVYSFKFGVQGVETTSRYETMSKDQLLNKIKKLSYKCRKSRDENEDSVDSELLTDFDDACLIAARKGWINEEQIKEINRNSSINRGSHFH